ncbi:hypothetical protein T484DRAFT_1822905 [Baffinella frigidus]|nr:hypothetical protein T484DRAFT_1822905 [Cryptophyta sp. CCMP2293]
MQSMVTSRGAATRLAGRVVAGGRGAGEKVAIRRAAFHGPSHRPLSSFINHEHRRNNHGRAEWWAERTFRFGTENQAILSFEIVTPYILGCIKTGVGALIDVGDAEASLDAAKNFGVEIKLVLQTHAHIDHVAGLADFKDIPAYRDVP